MKSFFYLILIIIIYIINIKCVLLNSNVWDGVEKIATGRVCRFAKPAASRLHAEAPWNYILGRLAAALQSVFEICTTPSRYFFDIYHILLCFLLVEIVLYY